MRKAQKKQAEDFIRLLGQAHLEVKKALETKKYEMARTLLEQCQDGAIELGNMIEEQEGEGFVTVSFLEEYCELVYQLHEEIWQKQMINPGKVYKSLKKQLIQIENSVKNDISTRIEAVFLPYKASMWDSLESVWQAADEDPDCDAYVIPIPYYDRNPDGSFGQMHDERHDYPDNVPVTDYESFDFAAHCPDMIFIHNPYDECNYVTSVHPFFYSTNLKKYTEKLVYIPYFILGDVDLENEEAIKEMAHFVTTPGVVNADKVVVQSENMRQAYIQAMVMVTGEHTRGHWEEKILGLGSPKIDKIMATRKEDVEVPEAWRKVIEKEDGSWKKIIFYNTSVSALLNHNEKMNAKIKDVLQVFKENQEEVALLWRPHPLIEATIKSVRPRLWEEYKEIVDGYRSEGWGIYDDSPDLDRAVALCDAYYGDPSSVVQLCQEAGVPVMYQTMDRVLFLETILDGGSFLWAVSWEKYGSTLFKINKETWKAKYIGMADNNDITQRKYENILEYKNKLYFIPRASDYLDIYDITKNFWKRYHIEDPTNENIIFPYNPSVKFSFAFPYGDDIYFFPHTYPLIMKYNIILEKIDYLYGCMDVFREQKGSILKNFFLKGFSDGEIITFYSRSANKILQFNMKSQILKILESFEGDESYDVFEYDSENYWLVPSNSRKSIIKWNLEKRIIEIDNTMVNFPDERVSFQFSAIEEGYLWLLPGLSNISCKFDLNTYSMKEAKELLPGNVLTNKSGEQWKFSCSVKTGKSLWIFDASDRKLIKFDFESRELLRECITIDLNDSTILEFNELVNQELCFQRDKCNKKRYDKENCLISMKIGKYIFSTIRK